MEKKYYLHSVQNSLHETQKEIFIYYETSRPHKLQQNVGGLDAKNSYEQMENINNADMRSW